MATSSAFRTVSVLSASPSISHTWCRYCRQSGHIRDRCPRLQCRQQTTPVFQSSPPASVSVDASTAASLSALEAQVVQFISQIQDMQHVSMSGTFSAMSAASGMLSPSWILDSDATHHMTSDATHLVGLSSVP